MPFGNIMLVGERVLAATALDGAQDSHKNNMFGETKALAWSLHRALAAEMDQPSKKSPP